MKKSRVLAVVIIISMCISFMSIVFVGVSAEPASDAEVEEIEISPYSDGFENKSFRQGFSEQTQLIINTTKDVPMDATWVLTISDGTTTKTIKTKASYSYSTWLKSFEVCLGEGENQFIPQKGTSYKISALIYDVNGNLIFKAPEAAGFNCNIDPIVVPTVTISPYGAGEQNGFENEAYYEGWDEQTQLLICTSEEIPDGSKWDITFKWDGGEKTIKGMFRTSHHEKRLSRFEICCLGEENSFIPVKGTEYTVSAKIYSNKDELIFKTTESSGFICGVDPIIPKKPGEGYDTPFYRELNIRTYDDTAFRNEDGHTELQIIAPGVGDISLDAIWEITFKWDGGEKTIKVKCTSYYADWYRGFNVCEYEGENRFIPEKGVDYTISADIYGEVLYYEGKQHVTVKETSGFVCNVDPIVPSTNHPATGDSAVYYIILGAAALIGMGVAVTKKVRSH